MNLSWLKRQLRKTGYPSFEDAQRLLDAIDRVYEDAQEYETILLHGDQDINPYTEMSRFVKENAGILVHVLLRIPSVGMQGVLDAMIASKGYEDVFHELEAWKKRPEEVEMQNEELLHDLDNHPFLMKSAVVKCASKGTVDYTGSYDSWGNTVSQLHSGIIQT